MASVSVQATNLSKVFQIKTGLRKDRVGKWLHLHEYKPFYALKDISFTAHEGESIGLIGLNGSGKSTLANIVSGVSEPTFGEIQIAGVPVLIAISAGLNLQMTGIENIEYKGLLMGKKLKEIQEITPQIIEFADIGEFIYQPVKTYSSGMRARLGFAISVHIDPDILVIDEALSVGDQSFTDKCLDRMNSFRKSNKTIFFVSHSLSQIEGFCDRLLWMEYGAVKAFGPVNEVLPMYGRFIAKYNKMTKEQQRQYRADVLKAQQALIQDGE